MSYYQDVYKKRLNRYGNDYQSRMQGKREKNFLIDLERSVFRVDFEYDNQMIPAILERYKQSETETLQYLRTETKIDLPAGVILNITNRTGQTNNWMVYWKEEITSSGYNRYVVLKMTHEITWKARDGQEYSTLAYMYGQQDNMLKDEIRSRSRMDTLYGENIKLSFFVTATNRNISKDDYFTITTPDKDGVDIIQGFRVTGFDIVSTPGIEYVSVDPIYLFNEDPTPEKTEEDSEEDFFWFKPSLTEV
jgi:hypothetical protein